MASPADGQDRERIFPGSSEMAYRMRSFDWSQTVLGAPEAWPLNLRTCVRIILTSRQPMFIWWGEQLIHLYNDGYIAILGAKHPAALAEPAPQVWSEVWHVAGPRAEFAMHRDEGTYDEALPFTMLRKGYPEETYVTFSYSPIPDDRGGFGGILCPAAEDTDRIIGERRLALLRELPARTADARKWQDACRLAVTAMETNPNDLPFTLIYSIDGKARSASLVASSGVEAGTKAAPETLALDAPGLWPVGEAYDQRRACLVSDLQDMSDTLPPVLGYPVRQTIVLPIVPPSETQMRVVLVAGLNPLRPLDGNYRNFLDLVAAAIQTAIVNAESYEAERRRAEALAALDHAKTLFFSNVSHEFRTPLTLILGPLEDAFAEPEASRPRERVEMVHRNALRLQKLVNTLLDFSRIEAGRIQASYEPTELAKLTGELASVFRSAVERAGMRLIVDCQALDEPVYVDPDMYEKIVLNLLSNAFKFSLEGEIEIRLQDAGEAVEISVRDTGAGIAQDQLPHVFERFHRIEGVKARTHEGTGIGLALVQELVRLHGGSMSVQSVLGQGSTFTVSIPKGAAHLPKDRIGAASGLASTALQVSHYVEEALRWLPSGATAASRPAAAGDLDDAPLPVSEESAGQRARIVWVDDNADMSEYVRRLLAPRYDVETAHDGETALASVRREPPDLVLADVMMPGLDGFGLLHALRADARTREIPVILLSARAGEEARVEGMQAGADDYLIKPFSARELLARVDAHVKLAQQRTRTTEALRVSEVRLRTIIEQMPAGVGVLDLNGVWTLSNSVMQRYVPKAMPSVLPDRVTHWQAWDERGNPIPPENWPGKRALRGETVMPGMEMLYTDDTGSEYWMRVSAAPLRDDEERVIGACAVVQDITQLKSAEQALRESDRRKDEFLATLAHELRNPLAPIRNGLDILRLAGANPQTAEITREMIGRQVNHMVRLVDDLMEISRISRGKIELRKESVELATVLRNAVETSRGLIDAGGHHLMISLPDEPLALEADPVRLAQVVSNLLNNAAKYTDQGGRIWLNAYREGASAVVSIRDDGVGISNAMLPKVFDLFEQGEHAYDRTLGGLGIGLTLARSLVEMHGGSIEAKSEGIGKGSEFLVRLPVSTEQRGPGERDRQKLASNALTGRRMLVVDDNREAADSLGTVLQLLGAQVRVAHDGPMALATLDTYRPDVALLDIGMPGMDGHELARRIRENPDNDRMMLIALTGWGQEEDRNRSHEAGIDRHLVKPVDMQALQRIVAQLPT